VLQRREAQPFVLVDLRGLSRSPHLDLAESVSETVNIYCSPAHYATMGITSDFMYSSAEVKKVQRVQFGILGPEEIVSVSHKMSRNEDVPLTIAYS